jgi:hypothetical protein
MALEIPQCPGDEFTNSTIIIDESVSAKNEYEQSNDYIVNFGLTLNCQIPQPMSLTLDSDAQYPLAGVGIQRPDGTWDETPQGELIFKRDADSNILILYII